MYDLKKFFCGQRGLSCIFNAMKRLFSASQRDFSCFMTIFQSLALAIFCVFLCASDSYAANVQKIRLGDHPDKTRLVIEVSGKLDYNAFILPAPQRLVVDFKGRNLSCASLGHVENNMLKFARHSSDGQTLRLVFDAKKNIKIKASFFLPAIDGKPNRLVIDLVGGAAKPSMQYTAQKQDKKQTTLIQAAPPYKAPTLAERPVRPIVARKHVVVLDAGHGGKDPGAVGAGGLYEKKVVLATVKRLKALLEASGHYEVVLTRDDDRYIRLSERVRIARRHNADLFMSVHADSVEKHTVRGASVYTLSEKATDAQTARLAARENKSDVIAGVDLSDEGQDVAAILIDLALRDTKNQSTFLAQELINSFKAHSIGTLRTPLHSAGFAVLKAPDIPSVLVEIGFMSNKSEARLLNTAAHQDKIAKALKKSIDSYFAKQTHYTD